MSADNVVARSLDEKSSGSALLVLGMHRSGTSAMAGVLGLCGAWVGEETELTGKNVENPLGFWERRDMRELCDGILHSASADWWRIAGFDPDAIPQEILAGHRRKFEEIVTALDEHGTWVVKEPRLCLVLPVLRDYIKNPVCIHIFRNPLEVAYSLQRRNGFSIAAGLALWETYNLRALSASGNLPRVSVSHESLMLHPVETLHALVDRLEELAVTNLAKPDGGLIKRFVDPSLYRQRVTDEETEDYLLPSQRALWLRLRSSEVFKHEGDVSVPQVTKRYLLDLESTGFSLARYQDTIRAREETIEKITQARDKRVGELEGRVRAREETIEKITQARDKRVGELEGRVRAREETIEKITQARDKRVGELEGRVRAREETIEKITQARNKRVGELEGRVRAREETIEKITQARDKRVGELEGRVRAREETIEKITQARNKRVGELEGRVRAREETIEKITQARDKRVSELEGRVRAREETIEKITQARNKRVGELEGRVRAREETIEKITQARDKRVSELEGRVRAREETIEKITQARNKRVGELEGRVRSREETIARYQDTVREREKRYQDTVREREKTIQARDKRVGELEGRVSAREETIARYQDTVREREKTIQARDKRVGELEGRVSAREETIARYQDTVREREKTIQAREKRVSDLEGRVRSREETIARYQDTIKDREKTIRARDKTIKQLLTSTSWKITAPLRGIKLGVRWFLRKLRHALRLLFWLLTGQFSRVVGAVRFLRAKSAAKPVSRPEEREVTAKGRLSELIRKRGKGQRIARAGPTDPRKRPVVGEARTKVTVIAWDLGHNPLGRAYLLADVLRHDYDVELIGAQFPRFGNEVWEPLRNCSRVTIKSFPGGNFPGHFKHMEDIAEQVEGDLIYVSKPRLPGLELAILAKLHRNRPVILDVDDYEPGFFNNRGPLTLDVVKTERHKFDFSCPHDETWTRYGESLIPLFEQVTVSNEELRKKFGGMILPHIRDEHDFNPTVYPRDAIRAKLGFTPEDKVILFAGTPRMHKGFDRIVAALERLNRPDYKLLVAGSPVDNKSKRFFKNINPERVKTVPNTPFCDLPGYLCAGDLICLLQDEDKVTSHFQMPAKFTDGLSMGIPMLATGVPPLVNLAKEGLVELLGDAPPERKIDEIFSDYEAYKHKAMQNREVFLREYSYGANLPRLRDTISRLLRDPAPIPDAFHELVACHREMFPGATDLPRVTAKVVARPAPVSQPVTPRPLQARSYIDGKMDIVFFWKQNDTGIYGRRQDMLVKYLAKDPRIHRILHFDTPVNIFKSGHDVLKSGQGGRHSHARLVFYQTLQRRLRLKDKDKVRFDTFIFGTQRRAPGFMKRLLPSEKDYLDYLARVLKRHQIGQRRTVFWVCPNNFDFPSIEDRFKPDLVVADVIDDQRKWPCNPLYKKKLSQNYEEILARCHLVFANCRSVFEAMRQFTDNIHLLPNAAEILEEEAQHWKKPAKLARIKGPVIGYAGNLDITRLDLDLLTTIASQRPDWNLVFIGSMHRNKDILKLNKFKNVYFLGVRPYDQALRYIRYFDVAMIPHLDNELTRHMNPLKLYVYFSLHVPVVTTPIANIENFGEFVQVGRTPEEFIDRVSYCLNNDMISANLERIRELLKVNSWDERVTRLLTLIEGDRCTVCGHTDYLRRRGEFIRETYECGNCEASLRYREQARLILKHFSRERSEHLAELARESEFQNLKIYEPGLIGPFRRLFHKLPGYRNSHYWEDVKPGEFREGVQCQDLMNLTYEDNSFDLVLSSDIFEHVRKPFVGFKEVNRVLKPGGFHIFSIPAKRPMPSKTVFRVDTSGPEDVPVLPKHYHSAPKGGKSLVYTDFGKDMAEFMAADGIDLKMESPCPDRYPVIITDQMLSFYWKKGVL